MNTFEISGGEKLKGEIIPQGAKNECLQILCAVLLTDEPIIVKNIPDIIDVNVLMNLLKNGKEMQKNAYLVRFYLCVCLYVYMQLQVCVYL